MIVGENPVIEERQAAALIGLSVVEIRYLARRNDLGHPRQGRKAAAGPGEDEVCGLVFTPRELIELSFLAACSND